MHGNHSIPVVGLRNLDAGASPGISSLILVVWCQLPQCSSLSRTLLRMMYHQDHAGKPYESGSSIVKPNLKQRKILFRVHLTLLGPMPINLARFFFPVAHGSGQQHETVRRLGKVARRDGFSKWRTRSINNTWKVRHFGEQPCRVHLPSPYFEGPPSKHIPHIQNPRD